MKHNTFHQNVYFCAPTDIQPSSELIEGTNEALLQLSELELDDEIPLPIIPENLIYKDEKQRLLMVANKIAKTALDIKKEKGGNESDILKAVSKMDFHFSKDFNEYFPETDPINSIFSYLKRRHPEVSFPSIEKPANNLIYSVFVLSPKLSDQSSSLTKLHQWIILLSTNTLSDLVNAIKCPLCELSSALAKEGKAPRKIETNEGIYYDFGDLFTEKIGNFVKNLNTPMLYTSEGGCSHLILFTSAFSISLDPLITSPNSTFPETIGGRGATPPFCSHCKINVGTVAVRASEDSPIDFLCLTCASSLQPEQIIKDLNGSFFHVL